MDLVHFMEFRKQYPAEWVVLQNKVVECFRGMSLDEKRLFLMATPLARVTKCSANEPIVITVEDYARECDIDRKTAYNAVEAATKGLFKREFTFETQDKNKVLMRWLYKAVYNDGRTELYFPDDILYILRNFDKVNPYTKYKKEIVLKLKKDYSLDFYHLGKKHEGLSRKFKLTIEELAESFNLSKSYMEDLGNLKRRVIQPSLDEIKEKTDIELTYENIKTGRKVTGFEFTVLTKKATTKTLENKQDHDPTNNKSIPHSSLSDNNPFKLTDKQLARIVHSKKFMSDYGSLVSAGNAANQSSGAWISHMVEWLKKDPERFNKRSMQIYLDDEQAPRF